MCADLLEGVVGKPVGVRVPPSAPVETNWRSATLGAIFVSTGALRGLERARGADRIGRKRGRERESESAGSPDDSNG